MASIFLIIYLQKDGSCLSSTFIYSRITRPFSQIPTLLTSIWLLLICSQREKSCFQVYLKDCYFPGKKGRWSGRVCLFPCNLQSDFFCVSTRVNLQHRYTHINLGLSSIKSLLIFQRSPGKKWVYQYEVSTSCILAHIIPSLLVLFLSENKLQSWSQIMGF